jgi:hypothetical protein
MAGRDGALIDAAGWRAAFVVPSTVASAGSAGLCCVTGFIQKKEAPDGVGLLEVGLEAGVPVLLVTILGGSSTTRQASLPK